MTYPRAPRVRPSLRKQILKRQGRACAICLKAKPLQVDHDHSSGAIRGLLCSQCNRGIGLLKDDPILLRRAIKYLKAGPIPELTRSPRQEYMHKYYLEKIKPGRFAK